MANPLSQFFDEPKPDPQPLNTFSEAMRVCYRVLGMDEPPLPTVGEAWESAGPKLANAAVNLRKRLESYRVQLEDDQVRAEVAHVTGDTADASYYAGFADALSEAVGNLGTVPAPRETEVEPAPEREPGQDWSWK